MRAVVPPAEPYQGVEPLRGAKLRSHASRLAVILAADTVDYTRHMAQDEAGTHARCKAVQRRLVEPAIARHDARVVKHTGDGFLAEFLSATQAVWFAVRFQDALRAWNARRRVERPLQFRIGINLGDVIVEPHDVFGHSVNIAVRLEANARPGGVLVSHAVFTSVRDPHLRFEEAGALVLKNVDEPVRGYHARAAREKAAVIKPAKAVHDRAARNGAVPKAVHLLAGTARRAA
jgi:class 3 adenylate cyclase